MKNLALSSAETQAIEILAGYGIDYPAAYIGRARPYLNTGHYDNRSPEAVAPVEGKTAQEIVDYVIELIQFDEDQKRYLERRKNEIELGKIYDRLATVLPATDEVTKELTRALSDEVARNRFNDGFEPIDCDLYKLKGSYYGKVRICGREFRIIARERRNSNDKKILKLSIRVEHRHNH